MEKEIEQLISDLKYQMKEINHEIRTANKLEHKFQYNYLLARKSDLDEFVYKLEIILDKFKTENTNKK